VTEASQQLVTMGRKPELVPNEELMEGINAGRKTIPFARFDKTRCAQGLEALRLYRTEWDEKAPRSNRAHRRRPPPD
jgi:phage terminase large subunit